MRGPDTNWNASRQRPRQTGICKSCDSQRTLSWKKQNPEKNRVVARRDLQKGAAPRVYVIVHPSWPRFVKVGMTTLNPTKRLGNLNVGDPMKRFTYAALVEVGDASEAEKLLHRTLDKFRVRQDGEWFRVPVDVAVRLAEGLRKRSSNDNE